MKGIIKGLLVGIILIGIVVAYFIFAMLTNPGEVSAETIEKTYSPYLDRSLSSYIQEDFNPKYGAITLTDASKNKLTEYSLTKNTEYCLINCEAEGKAVFYQDGILFDDIRFKTLTGKDTLIKSHEYLLFNGYKEAFIDVPATYKSVACVNSEVNKNCEVVDTYKKINISKEVWINYDGNILKGNSTGIGYRWKVKGIKEPYQSVDFQLIKDSKVFNEWAVWNSSFTAGLVLYYPLNDTTEAVGGFQNFTAKAGTPSYGSYPDCLIGGCVNVTVGNIPMLAQSSYTNKIRRDNNSDFTLNFWGRARSWDNTNTILMVGNTNYAKAIIGSTTTFAVGSGFLNADKAYSKDNTNSWFMMTYTINSSGTYSFYKNGSLMFNGTSATLWGENVEYNSQFVFGRIWITDGSYDFDGYFDEIGIWNRTLSASEIADLWNNQTGLSYNPVGIVYRTIIGKVVDGNNNIVNNATVLILNYTGQLIATTYSNSSGDWGYTFVNGTITNYTIVGYNTHNISQGGNAYPFFSG